MSETQLLAFRDMLWVDFADAERQYRDAISRLAVVQGQRRAVRKRIQGIERLLREEGVSVNGEASPQ